MNRGPADRIRGRAALVRPPAGLPSSSQRLCLAPGRSRCYISAFAHTGRPPLLLRQQPCLAHAAKCWPCTAGNDSSVVSTKAPRPCGAQDQGQGQMQAQAGAGVHKKGRAMRGSTPPAVATSIRVSRRQQGHAPLPPLPPASEAALPPRLHLTDRARL